MEIRGFDQDMARMFALITRRKEIIAGAPGEIDLSDPIKDLVRRLHPPEIKMVVTGVKEEKTNTRTFRFQPASSESLPFFRAGQYLSIKAAVNGVKITRPYSISSAPAEAGSFYELTVVRKENGFMTEHIWEKWKEGTAVLATGPHGYFYHDRLRDSLDVVALVGGDSITPIRAMAREIALSGSDIRLIIIYGICHSRDIIFKNELEDLSGLVPGKINVCHIVSETDKGWQGRKGFIDAEQTKDIVGDFSGKTFFICGPAVMREFCTEQLALLEVPQQMIRREILGPAEDITTEPRFPVELKEKQFTIRVGRRGSLKEIPADATETVLVAFERAGLEPESQCRSGECGFCRSLLLNGKVYQRQGSDGRRAGDKKYGYFHPCSAYPIGDLELIIP